METRTGRAERREEPLSRERIVQAAVELLDASGEKGLTFRALAERLATGPGAIYWHITGKDEVLGAATDAVIADAMSPGSADATPQEAVRALALGLFDTIDAHPWVGSQLARAPWQSAMLRVFERIGRLVRALGVPPSAEFTSASALFNYILGVGGQNAANARAHEPGATRTELLDNVSVAWAELDPDEYAFIRSAADRLREHDDRTEFLAGLDLILSGITATLI